MSERDKNENRMRDLDDFWDLDALMPTKKRSRPFARDTETVRLTLSEEADSDPGAQPIPPPDQTRLERARRALADAEQKYALRSVGSLANSPKPIAVTDPSDPREEAYLRAQKKRDELEAQYRRGREEAIPPVPPSAPDPLETDAYQPEDNPLITRVRVFRITPPSAPDRIRDQALAAFHALSPEKQPPAAPFRAAIPGYESMNAEQRAWYLWWRAEARRGRYLPTDSAYVYLYAYETLNLLPSPIEPEQALKTLIALWDAYRTEEPRLDYLIPEWICDLCLVYQRSLPKEFPPSLLTVALRVTFLKEFYLGACSGQGASSFAHAVLRYGLNYRWQSSKFITPENQTLFETHIPAAFLYAFSRLEEAEKQSETFGICAKRALRFTAVRHTFAGSSFAQSIKRRLLVEHLSCSRSIELRFMATDLIKYAENQVRRMLGIKSRFHTAHLDPRLKAAVDEYFSPLLPKMTKKREVAPTEPPVYEALYEAPSVPFSPQAARQIEKSAWTITQKLVESFEEPTAIAEEPPSPETGTPAADKPETVKEEKKEKKNGGSEDELIRCAFALLLGQKDDEFALLAKKHGMLPLTLAEKMNECALDVLGDIAVTEADGVLRLIADYKEDVVQWLNL